MLRDAEKYTKESYVLKAAIKWGRPLPIIRFLADSFPHELALPRHQPMHAFAHEKGVKEEGVTKVGDARAGGTPCLSFGKVREEAMVALRTVTQEARALSARRAVSWMRVVSSCL